MSAPRDPAWVAVASRLYDACLWLYPRALRDAHGDEMRQAFRDRCREVASGRRSGLQCAVELAPDLLGSATRAQLEAGSSQDARVIPGLVILVGVALALATQPLWSGSAVNGMKAVESTWLMWREQREIARRDELLQRVSSELVATGTPDAVATAALLQQARAEQERWYAGPLLGGTWDALAHEQTWYFPQAAAEAAQLAGRVAAGHARGPALAIAAQACSIRGGCNVDFVIGRLLAVEPRNALGWMLAFKRAAHRGDAAAMQTALEGAAAAEYYDSYQARVYALLQRQLAASGHVDADTSAILAEHAARMRWVLTDDWQDDLRSRCSFGSGQPAPPNTRWLEAHPEARADCLRVAGLLAGSTSDLQASLWGWRQLRRVQAPIAPEGVRAMRDAAWLQRHGAMRAFVHANAVGHGWTPWTADDWARWNASWAAGDGDVPSMRRWARAAGIPEHAPADFDAFPGG